MAIGRYANPGVTRTDTVAVGSREGRKQARAFWDDRRTMRSGITVRGLSCCFLLVRHCLA
jgi:hypothetical protein